ncbi:hypothetical protein JOD01_003294 [Brevibacillus fulvus]|uniref:Uncharacterized protein n=1 Tax=Brevibacillus fulvus TaxID=1125967 RepID=A0A938Y1W2_9BACL|nr:hypothetical protein [Brevibacillus fulvus]
MLPKQQPVRQKKHPLNTVRVLKFLGRPAPKH